MATAKNDVTGDALRSRAPSKQYQDGWERIFGNKDKQSSTNEKEEVKQERKD